MYLPGDGWLDPSGATMELAARARRLGVEINTGVRVTGITRTSRGDVAAVETDRGTIRTEILVDAGGMWAGQIAVLVGVATCRSRRSSTSISRRNRFPAANSRRDAVPA